MKDAFHLAIIPVSVLSLALTTTTSAQPQSASADKTRATQLQTLTDGAVRQTLAKFAGQQLKSDQLAVTLVDLRDRQHPDLGLVGPETSEEERRRGASDTRVERNVFDAIRDLMADPEEPPRGRIGFHQP